MLAHEVRGTGSRVVLVHGFTQNRRCWGAFADRLAEHHQVVLVDAPGHGASHHDDADLGEAGRLLLEVGGEAAYVGYSMGGRMVLHAALEQPGLVTSMVLIGATPGIVDAEQRADRRAADTERADALERDGVSTFLDHWLDLPLFTGITESQQFRSERESNRSAGLASSLRRCGTGAQEPLWNRLAELAMPVTLIVGERDDKFRVVADRMAGQMQATVGIVHGVGHAAHLEDPDATAALVSSALEGPSSAVR